jgi:hypothetical protein
MSVEQYEALLETAERRRAVAAALASLRAEGLESSGGDIFGGLAPADRRCSAWRGCASR